MGQPEAKRPLRRTRHRWDDNINMNLQVVGCRGRGMDWIDLDQDRNRWQAHVNVIMNFWVA